MLPEAVPDSEAPVPSPVDTEAELEPVLLLLLSEEAETPLSAFADAEELPVLSDADAAALPVSADAEAAFADAEAVSAEADAELCTPTEKDSFPELSCVCPASVYSAAVWAAAVSSEAYTNEAGFGIGVLTVISAAASTRLDILLNKPLYFFKSSP